jgi:hypothetical protein
MAEEGEKEEGKDEGEVIKDN